MNIEKANAIPLSEILIVLGRAAIKSTAKEQWYYSPLREERTPSFKVNVQSNTWRDFGIGKGGDVVNLICEYLQSQGADSNVPDALRWIKNMSPSFDIQSAFNYTPVAHKNEPAFKLLKISEIYNSNLIAWIESRGIEFALAKQYLKQAYVRNLDKEFNFNTLALKHVNDGYELMKPGGFKSSVRGKAISFIRGIQTNNIVHVFEGVFDFLSALSALKKERFPDDVIILNSVANLRMGLTYISTNPYNTIDAWLDNDKAGEVATLEMQEFAQERNIVFKRSNDIYKPFNDVNDWHKSKLGLA